MQCVIAPRELLKQFMGNYYKKRRQPTFLERRNRAEPVTVPHPMIALK
jgi:hypothetical protein